MYADKKESPSKSMTMMTVKGSKSSSSYKAIKDKKDSGSGKGKGDKMTKGSSSTEKHSKKKNSTKSSMKKIMLKSMMGKGKGKGKGKGTTTPPTTTFPTQAPLPETGTPTEDQTTPNPTATPTAAPTATPTVGTTSSPTSPTGTPTLSPTGPSGRPEFCFDPTGETCGPDAWPDLDIENNQCGGSRNSPIAIPSFDFCEPVDYVFMNGTCTYGELDYVVNAYKISAVYPDSCTAPSVMIGDLTYSVESWSYSLGTSHVINEEATIGSVEILHSLVEGDEFAEPFAIIGIGTVFGASDPFVDRVINGFVGGYIESAEDCDLPRDPIYEGSAAPNEIANPYDMLPQAPTFYQYLGSRTVPPCEEDVFWNHLSLYTSIDASQGDTLRSLILNWINPLTCRFGTVADPETGSTSRPPSDPGTRPISLTGECGST